MGIKITCRPSSRGPILLLQGEEISIDYAPSKLDNQVLLDHGVIDTTAPKVRPTAILSSNNAESHCKYTMSQLNVLGRLCMM